MRQVSDVFRQILAGEHWTEYRVSIADEEGLLSDNEGNAITFGGTAIVLDKISSGYSEHWMYSLATDVRLFSQDTPTVGSCVSGEISLTIIKPRNTIPRQAKIIPYACITNGRQRSEWIQKGVYFIDTRREEKIYNGEVKMIIHGYDAMLKLETSFPSTEHEWPASDITVVQDIAAHIGLEIDPRTVTLMNKGYDVQLPGSFTCRETLGYIASMYAGCFIMSDEGKLRLVQLIGGDLDAES